MTKIKLFLLTLGALYMTHTTQAQDIKNTKETAIFAGGCFWCMEQYFAEVNGVVSVVSGYTGGESKNPTYEQVSSGKSGHVEAVEITYNPSVITYEKLLKKYWVAIDPTVENRQFCDVGPQYHSVIFYQNSQQKQLAEQTKKALENMGIPIKTSIKPAKVFYKAEEYHQDYYKKNPTRYKYYKLTCGRENRLDNLWGKNRSYPEDGTLWKKEELEQK